MMKPTLQLRLGQQLAMTPQLQQAIRLLQLTALDLQAQIRETLESNVMLEAEEDDQLSSLEEMAAASSSPGEDDAGDAGEVEPTVETGDEWPEATAASSDAPWSGGDDDRILELPDGSRVLRIENLDTDNGPDLKVWLTEGDVASCREWTLRLGHLEPVETTFGLKGHLANLGYDCAPVDDVIDDKTKQALTAFQNDHGLAATGQSDAATQAKLRELFRYPVESGA